MSPSQKGEVAAVTSIVAEEEQVGNADQEKSGADNGNILSDTPQSSSTPGGAASQSCARTTTIATSSGSESLFNASFMGNNSEPHMLIIPPTSLVESVVMLAPELKDIYLKTSGHKRIMEELTVVLLPSVSASKTRPGDAMITSLSLEDTSCFADVASSSGNPHLLENLTIIQTETPPSFSDSCNSLQFKHVGRPPGMLKSDTAEFVQGGDKMEAGKVDERDEKSKIGSVPGHDKHEGKKSSTDEIENTFDESNNDAEKGELRVKTDEKNGKGRCIIKEAEQAVDEKEEEMKYMRTRSNEEKGGQPEDEKRMAYETSSVYDGEIIYCRKSRALTRKRRLADLAVSNVTRTISAKQAKVGNSLDCICNMESKLNIDFSDENDTQNQPEIKPKPSGKSRVKRLSKKRHRHRIAYDDTGQGKVRQNEMTEGYLSFRTGTEMLQDDRGAEESFIDAHSPVTYIDPFCVKKDVMCDGAFYVHDSCKWTTSLSSGEILASAEAGKLEMPTMKEDIWSQMESLCERKQSEVSKRDQETFDSVRANKLLQNNSFLRSKGQVRLESKPASEAVPLTKTLLYLNSLLGGYIVKQSAQSIGDCRRNRTKAEAHSRCNRGMKRLFVSKFKSYMSQSLIHHSRRSYISPDSSSRSRSRSPSTDSCSASCRSRSCDSIDSDEFCSRRRSSQRYSIRCHVQHYQTTSSSTQQQSHGNRSSRSRSSNHFHSRSYSRSPSRTYSSHSRSLSPGGLLAIKKLFRPLVLPASVTTLIVAPVTGYTGPRKGAGGNGAIGGPPNNVSAPKRDSAAAAAANQEKDKKENADVSLSKAGDQSRRESQETSDANPISSAASGSTLSQSVAGTTVNTFKSESGNPAHHPEPQTRTLDQAGEHSEHSFHRDYNHPRFNHLDYHSAPDPSFSEDTGYENFEFYGGEYDNYYNEEQYEYNFTNDSYHNLPQRFPGPNMHYPRRPLPQGPQGPPPSMFAPNDPSFGPRAGMGPPARMGRNGPMGSRGPRPPLGSRGPIPSMGSRGRLPGGPMGPPRMRGISRGPPYGPPGPRYGPPGHMRPPGLRGPPGPGMMGPAGQAGPGGPRPRNGPPPRMGSPLLRQSSQTPGGPRPQMGPALAGPPPRDGQYPPPRPAMLPRSPGDRSFHGPMLNLSQPPPNFSVPPSSQLTSATTSAAGSGTIITDAAEPPPLPPPKPPSPKPPPPPKKEEEKKEEIKPMAPLIPPEQAEQYRKLREQARKHARKQLRKQEHQAKGEPESSDDDEEEKAKKKEYEVRLTAEREEMEKAAFFAQNDEEVQFEEGAAILMPATQPTMIQQPTMVFQHPHQMTTLPSSYGLMAAPQYVHASHPGQHASQFQGLQFMTSPSQPQLVQLPNGQLAYATPAPMTYQTSSPMMAMSPQSIPSGQMPHHLMLSPGGVHQVQMAASAHPGYAVSGSQYMSHMMAAQAQAAQIQAAQAQAAQIQAAQVQAAQVQAAQVQAAQAAQAAQAQPAQLHGYVPGVHMAQQYFTAINSQGQLVLVPRARPQM